MIDDTTLTAAGFTPEPGRVPHWIRLHGARPVWWQGEWAAKGGNVGDRAVAIRFRPDVREASLTVLADAGGGDSASSRVTYEPHETVGEVIGRLVSNLGAAWAEAGRQVAGKE